jgi:oxygen-independent coproporphyrinogen-3 oxidase
LSSPIAIPRELLEKYATSAPRYTSYPTAVDWASGFEPERYPDLLARASERDDPLSVYFHIPFCAERCLFCGCNVVITRNEDRVEQYLTVLENEIARVGESGIGRRRVHQYHWGGGTPTHLDLAQIERVQAAFSRVFSLTDDAEVAIEVDPRVTTPAQIELLAQLGFNRISLGVQDFDEKVQVDIKRVQSEEETREIVDAARAAGMGSLNIDLIYGLPHQTRGGFESTVDRILDIRPERVALFHYAHVPWIKKHQTAMTLDAIQSAEDKLSTFLRAVEQFQDAGYVYIGLDHFALPDDELAVALQKGELHRNFMGYTTRRGSEMVSCGVSAIGEVDGSFVQNDPNEHEYLRRVRENGFATHRGHELSADDALRRDVILGLMCNGILRKADIEGRHGIDFDATFAEELAELAPLAEDGLVALDADALRLSPLGQMFMRNVALPFDRYFKARKARGETGKSTFSKTL